MYDFSTLYRDTETDAFYVTDKSTSEITEILPIFSPDVWDSAEAYKFANIKGYEPMTAKELETEEQQESCFNSKDYYIEEKFDGTRAIVQFFGQLDVDGNELGYCRVFSRRISKKTGFYVENTDLLPQIREINIPELAGTVLDGELFIDGRPFKDVSSTLNCLWDKAVSRQIDIGFVTLHAFDIIKYKGIDLRKMPLERRKHYLHLAVEEANSPYIKEVEYFSCGSVISGSKLMYLDRIEGGDEDLFLALVYKYKASYPELYRCICLDNSNLTPKAFYELVVATGGEGVIIKPKKGKYYHKRGWEYSKIKKFLTREMIIMGFEEPTKEYTGKEIKKWSHWENKSTGEKKIGNFYGDSNYMPVTKHYFYGRVGVMKLGVIINKTDYANLPKNKRGECVNAFEFFEGISQHYNTNYKDWLVMCVCECGGMQDEERDYFTKNRDSLIGTVVEVKANDIMRDSGRLRHPRYLRERPDKEAERCTWSEHIM